MGDKMRKTNKFFPMIVVFILGFQLTFTKLAYANTAYPPDLPYQPPKQSREELYQDIFISQFVNF